MRFARLLAGSLALALVLALAASPAGASPDDEAAFVAQINELRARAGAPALSVDPRLTEVSRRWADRMAKAGAISHRTDLAAQAPAGTWAKLGENVGVGPSVEALHQAFVASPSHHRNLVDPAFRSVGVGIVKVGATIYVAETFLAPTAAKATPAPRAKTKARAKTAARLTAARR